MKCPVCDVYTTNPDLCDKCHAIVEATLNEDMTVDDLVTMDYEPIVVKVPEETNVSLTRMFSRQNLVQGNEVQS